MKISILLPYKENFSPVYPGAVSLFVKDTGNVSKYKKDIVVYGNTAFKKIFNLKYFNINLSSFKFASKSKQYVKKFIKIEEKYPSDLIEIHNRPNYLLDIVNTLGKKNLVLYFHNDPLTMTGSKSIKENLEIVKEGNVSKDEMIIRNQGLVRKLASTHINQNVPIDDLTQVGTEGLLRAVEKFAPNRGYKFSTYARAWIKQTINQSIFSILK